MFQSYTIRCINYQLNLCLCPHARLYDVGLTTHPTENDTFCNERWFKELFIGYDGIRNLALKKNGGVLTFYTSDGIGNLV